MIRAVVLLVGALTGTGLIAGVLLAGIAALLRLDSASMLTWMANAYYGLAVLFPIVLWATLYVTHNDDEYAEAYDSPLRALLTALQGAIIGGILAGGPVFLAGAINLPVLFLGVDIGQFGPALRDSIVWSRLLIVTGGTVGCAIPLGLWTHYIAFREVD